MPKLLLVSLALAAAVSSALPAAAQEATPMPSPSATGSASPSASPSGAPASSRTATMSVPGQPGFGDLMSSLSRMKAEVAQVRSLRMLSTNDVRIVKVQSIAAGNDTAALNSALSRNASQLAALRGALANVRLTAATDNHQLTFAQFLADNRMSISQVVAADVSGGKLTAFIQ